MNVKDPWRVQLALNLCPNMPIWDRIVSFFDLTINKWVAHRADINVSAANRSRDVALDTVLEPRTYESAGRPPENKFYWSGRFSLIVLSQLTELSKHTGLGKSALISLLIMKAYAAYSEVILSANPDIVDADSRKYDDQQRMFLIGSVKANIVTDREILELINLEEESEERLESFENYYTHLDDEQQRCALFIENVQRHATPGRYTVRYFLTCPFCEIENWPGKARRMVEQLEHCNAHPTSMTYRSTFLPLKQRVRHCMECGMVTGPIEHPQYLKCEQHKSAGITENYFQ